MILRLRTLVGLLVFGAWAPLSHATFISYTVSNVTESTWRYDYSISNNTLSTPIDEFTIFFDQTLFSELTMLASPVGWDVLVVQPDLALPDRGFFDALAIGGGIASGATLSGFSLSFQWLGADTPGSQPFHIIDPLDFSAIEEGVTMAEVSAPPVGVPEPSTLVLLSLGLIGVSLSRRSRTRATWVR
jgi:hypothetical protein